ncbi:MAG TPA: hypothetical protein VMT15_14800 [Bryobacteraceae bacterium]|nr:hypothetical protein [Bryobacteraceae bacterium]
MKALLLLAAVVAHAEVIDSSASGFTVKAVLTVKASPEVVMDKLIHNVGDWWHPAHTYSHDPHNLKIEAKPGGCWCEKVGDGFVKHLEVIHYRPPGYIAFSGAPGPLQAQAVTGTLQVQLSAAEGGTKLEMTYAVGGYLAKGLNSWASIIDTVFTEQFTRLKNYVETGQPAPAK